MRLRRAAAAVGGGARPASGPWARPLRRWVGRERRLVVAVDGAVVVAGILVVRDFPVWVVEMKLRRGANKVNETGVGLGGRAEES